MLLLGVPSLLVADDHHRLAHEPREPAHHRQIVGERAVAVQLLDIGEERVQVVERIRALRMPRDLRDLPRRELRVDLLGERLAALLQARDLLGDVDRGVVLHETQLVDPRLELGDRLLEFEKGGFHDAAGILNHDPGPQSALHVSTPPVRARGSARDTTSPPSATAPSARRARAARRRRPPRRRNSAGSARAAGRGRPPETRPDGAG